MVAFSLGGPELLVVLGIVVLLFGAKKLPELARSVGRSTSEFKKGVEEGQSTEGSAASSGDGEPPADRKTESSE